MFDESRSRWVDDGGDAEHDKPGTKKRNFLFVNFDEILTKFCCELIVNKKSRQKNLVKSKNQFHEFFS